MACLVAPWEAIDACQDSNLKYIMRRSNAAIELQAEPLGFKVRAPDASTFRLVEDMIRDLLDSEQIAPCSEEG